MCSVLVTVVAPTGRVDLAVADDAPLADLIPTLVRRCEPGAAPWSRWALGPLGGEPFAPGRTLGALGVLDGAELELRDMAGALTAPEAGVTAGGDGEWDRRRRHITALVERLVDDIARIRTGNNPLLEYAGPEARLRLRALAPGPFDREAASRASDLGLEVTWHRDRRAPVEAVAVFTESAGTADPAWSCTAPAVARAYRVTVRLTTDPECRYLLDAGIGG